MRRVLVAVIIILENLVGSHPGVKEETLVDIASAIAILKRLTDPSKEVPGEEGEEVNPTPKGGDPGNVA
jgi:hypothetical protein